MNTQTKIYKSDNQWIAETTIDFEELDLHRTRFLSLITSKHGGKQITTTASVAIRKEENGYSVVQSIIPDDYRKYSISTIEAKRVTEKAIREAHEQALSLQYHIINEAKAFYALPENQYLSDNIQKL